MKENIFLKSALTEDNPFIKTEEVIDWLKVRNEETRVNISRVSFQDLDQWYIDQTEGRIRHRSGKFFSIDGISAKTNWGDVNQWQQPIINQPEIGILGADNQLQKLLSDFYAAIQSDYSKNFKIYSCNLSC